ncbi:PE-PPE domain-containing protein [Rhodococcus sp. 66b]|uniref:PE-PPE domain-containing protein n=1 Tax=Rhodococcus sp. 66b TaxID=1945511 RepID=UPI0009BA9E3B|nr:PE-PPE domain-containing protein [Rhodococcus sp. 66b]OQM82040.1 hypothetical protein B0E55_01665 [Rhodococcus sp. 66b]
MRIASIRRCAFLLLSSACALVALGSTATARTAVVVGGTSAPEAEYIINTLVGYDDIRVVDYPASVLIPSYDISVATGSGNLRAALAEVDDDEVTVIGFSQGARIAGDVLTEPQNAGVTGVLYSDPRQAGSGVETQTWLPGVLGATMSGERGEFTVPVESKCIPGDGVCDWRNDDPLGSVVGYLQHHQHYFD